MGIPAPSLAIIGLVQQLGNADLATREWALETLITHPDSRLDDGGLDIQTWPWFFLCIWSVCEKAYRIYAAEDQETLYHARDLFSEVVLLFIGHCKKPNIHLDFAAQNDPIIGLQGYLFTIARRLLSDDRPASFSSRLRRLLREVRNGSPPKWLGQATAQFDQHMVERILSQLLADFDPASPRISIERISVFLGVESSVLETITNHTIRLELPDQISLEGLSSHPGSALASNQSGKVDQDSDNTAAKRRRWIALLRQKARLLHAPRTSKGQLLTYIADVSEDADPALVAALETPALAALMEQLFGTEDPTLKAYSTDIDYEHLLRWLARQRMQDPTAWIPAGGTRRKIRANLYTAYYQLRQFFASDKDLVAAWQQWKEDLE